MLVRTERGLWAVPRDGRARAGDVASAGNGGAFALPIVYGLDNVESAVGELSGSMRLDRLAASIWSPTHDRPHSVGLAADGPHTIAALGRSAAPYLIRGGQIAQLTRDHRLGAESVDAGCWSQEAENHPTQRHNARVGVSRAQMVP